jgi:hypothetical protein
MAILETSTTRGRERAARAHQVREHHRTRPSAAGWLKAGAGAALAGYAAYVLVAWSRYGRVQPPAGSESDPLLDRFMPVYEVRGRHHVRVAAPASVTLAAAREMDLQHSPIARAIVRTREVILGAAPAGPRRATGLLEEVQALGWGVLAEVPDREIVVGAVTRPWEADVVFRAIPPHEFAAFSEPDYVKIAWTLRADPRGEHDSVFSTETRAVATDAAARARFRLYWSFFSPGMALIRLLSLGPLKKGAERRARERAEAG